MNVFFSYLISYIVEAPIIHLYITHMFETKRKNSSVLFCISFFYFIQLLTSSFHNVLINCLAFFVLNIIIIVLCTPSPFKAAFFHSCFLFGIMSSSEILSTLLIPKSFYAKYPAPDLTVPSMIVCFTISKCLYFIFVLMAIRWNNKKSGHTSFHAPVHLIGIALLSSLLLFIVNYLVTHFVFDSFTEGLLALSSICIIIINIIMFWLQEYIQQKQAELYNLNFQYQQEKLSKNYSELLNEQHQNQRILMHDIKNHLQVIYSMCEKNNDHASCSYIKEIIESPAVARNVAPTASRELNLILGIYIPRCEHEGIALSIDCQNINFDFISPYDMTALFCNLLDNAFTSAKSTNNPYIELSIKQKSDTCQTIIALKNSCINSPSISNNGELMTTKSNGDLHGIGQYSIKSIINKYDGHIKNTYVEKEASFHTLILLKSKGEEKCR